MNIFLIILFIYIIMLIFLHLIKNKEKFNDVILSPEIIKIQKKNNNANIEWINNDNRIKEFLILYIDVNSPNKGVWITESIQCNKKNCSFILKNLNGNNYNLTILSKLNDKNISKLKNIINFSDTKDYNNNNNDIINKNINNINNININNPAPNISNINNNNINNNNINNNNNDNDNKESPGPSIEPHFDCSKIISRVNIKNEEDLKNSIIKYNCTEDKDMNDLRNIINEKPFYHKIWEKLF